MQISRDVNTGFGILVGLNLVLAFLAIALFVRMGPAIQKVFEENITSTTAAEEMLTALVLRDSEEGLVERPRAFAEALARARGNISEEAERELIAHIEGRFESALEGDEDAVIEVTESIRQLSSINRNAVRRADNQARRMGLSGAWMAAFAALLAYLLGLLIMRRVRRRLTAPVEEIYVVLRAVREGNRFRRCARFDGPEELKAILEMTNENLDKIQLGSNRQNLT